MSVIDEVHWGGKDRISNLEDAVTAIQNGGSVPFSAVSEITGDQTAAAGTTYVCNGSVLQTVTMPAVFSVGQQIAVVRGTSAQKLVVAPGAGATISGQTRWVSPSDIVARNGNARIILVAIDSTTWAPIASEGFFPDLYSGYGIPFNDVAIHGTLYMLYNLWLSNSKAVTTTYTTTANDLVLLCTGSGYTITANATFGQYEVLFVKNNGTGTITFAPASGGTIDGAASVAIPAGTGIVVQFVGASGTAGNWTTLVGGTVPATAYGQGIGVQYEPGSPLLFSTQTAPTSGTIYGTAVYAQAGSSITGIKLRNAVAAAGTAPTTGRFGLLDYTGKVLALSGNVNAASNWTAGAPAFPFTSPFTLSYSGIYIPCYIVNGTWGTTQPTPSQISRGSGADMVADGSSPPVNFSLAGQTDIPAVGSNVNITAGATRSYYLALY